MCHDNVGLGSKDNVGIAWGSPVPAQEMGGQTFAKMSGMLDLSRDEKAACPPEPWRRGPRARAPYIIGIAWRRLVVI